MINNMINFILCKIDELRAFIISIISASTGSVLGLVNEENSKAMLSTIQQSHTWFEIASPILQTIAWSIAIISGCFAIAKTALDLRKNYKNKK